MSGKMTRAERSWVLYDVGNSAFIMLVSTTIPIYFKELAAAGGIDTVYATGLWATVTAAAVLILALLSPLLGALADYQGMKKKLFAGALVLGLAGFTALALTGSWLPHHRALVGGAGRAPAQKRAADPFPRRPPRPPDARVLAPACDLRQAAAG